MSITEQMFDDRDIDAEHPTFVPGEPAAMVDMQAALPGLGRRMDGIAMRRRASGPRLSPICPGVKLRGCADFLCTSQRDRCKAARHRRMQRGWRFGV